MARRAQTRVGRQGACRDTTQWRFDGIPRGGYDTQDDAREILACARARGATS